MPHGYWRPPPRNARGKKLSQGDIEKRTGLLRCYISRVENGHTVPAIETLEKLARALDARCINSSTTAKSRLVAEPLEAEVIRRHRLGQ